MTRPTLAQVLMQQAELWATRSTCARAHNGVVVADESGRVLSTGYNGTLSGQKHCDHSCTCNPVPVSYRPDEDVKMEHEYGCLKDSPCKGAVHAEANAVYWAARRGVSLEGSTMSCTMSPCVNCAMAIVQSGITAVVYGKAYRDLSGIDLLSSCGVTVFLLRSDVPEEIRRAVPLADCICINERQVHEIHCQYKKWVD